MRILILGDAFSSHIIKWAKEVTNAGQEVQIFTFSNYPSPFLIGCPAIKVVSAGINKSNYSYAAGSFNKWRYFLVLPKLINTIFCFRPGVLHAHFASSYGLIGALSFFKPLYVSVWGSDVFEFPQKSHFHSMFLKFTFKKASKIFSTSHVMAKEISKYSHKNIEVLAFGVDTSLFRPIHKQGKFRRDRIVIGMVKSLEDRYGVELLVESFNKVKKISDQPLELLLVGDGSLRQKLEKRVEELNIREAVKFVGKVDNESTIELHNSMDIEVYLSKFESFGVSVLEASACAKPVIVNRAGGLVEVVNENSTGIIVTPEKPQEIIEALLKLINDVDLRTTMGNAGRVFVTSNFEIKNGTRKMLEAYREADIEFIS